MVPARSRDVGNKRRKKIMAKDYICLKCGNHFMLHHCAEEKCSKCGSANVLKLNPAGLFGSSGGGSG